MKFTRKQTIITVLIVIVLLLASFGVYKAFPKSFNKYAGLNTTMIVQMDEATRTLLKERIATTQASIDAAEEKGEKISMNLYLIIAENNYMLGDLVTARETYEKYLTLNPISYVAHNSYAVVLERMGDYTKAETAFKSAIDGMKSEEYFRDYAEFLQAYFPERTSDYKAVLDDAFNNLGQTPWMMITLGDWDFSTGDCTQGRAHYDVAKTLTKDVVTASQIIADKNLKTLACQVK